MPNNPVVSWEMMTKDAPKQKTFYTEMFNWKFDSDASSGFSNVDTGNFNGGIYQAPGAQTGELYFYVQVPDVQATVDKAVRLGGRIASPVTQASDGTKVAMIQDPEGNLVGLIQG